MIHVDEGIFIFFKLYRKFNFVFFSETFAEDLVSVVKEKNFLSTMKLLFDFTREKKSYRIHCAFDYFSLMVLFNDNSNSIDDSKSLSNKNIYSLL